MSMKGKSASLIVLSAGCLPICSPQSPELPRKGSCVAMAAFHSLRGPGRGHRRAAGLSPESHGRWPAAGGGSRLTEGMDEGPLWSVQVLVVRGQMLEGLCLAASPPLAPHGHSDSLWGVRLPCCVQQMPFRECLPGET